MFLSNIIPRSALFVTKKFDAEGENPVGAFMVY
jgi:hypothetical protein